MRVRPSLWNFFETPAACSSEFCLEFKHFSIKIYGLANANNRTSRVKRQGHLGPRVLVRYRGRERPPDRRRRGGQRVGEGEQPQQNRRPGLPSRLPPPLRTGTATPPGPRLARLALPLMCSSTTHGGALTSLALCRRCLTHFIDVDGGVILPGTE